MGEFVSHIHVYLVLAGQIPNLTIALQFDPGKVALQLSH